MTGERYNVTMRFSFCDGIDIEDIAIRKAAFRNEWGDFLKNPSNPIRALRLVHAAFEAEQQDALRDLLLNPVLVDSASLLLSLTEIEKACETLIKWSRVLQHHQRSLESIQILEDALATGMALPSVADELRGLHYSWAQYTDPTTGGQPTPDVRVEHLRRILELGFEYDYICKFMAEAYHDLGDDEQARAYLRKAYELNPGLSGAVRISRALGFSESSELSPRKQKTSTRHKYSRPEQIPSYVQIHKWTTTGSWDEIIDCANPQDYSPRLLPQAREILRQIAKSLADCRNPKAIDALIALLNFNYYWDVSEAAMISLSKIGDECTLDVLGRFRAGNSRGQKLWEACVSYLGARVSNQLSPATKAAPAVLLTQAEEAFSMEDYGQTRFVLENLLANIEQSDPLYPNAALLLARSCAEMNDSRTSVELIKPLLSKWPERLRGSVSQEVASWLWNDLAFQEYAPMNDEDYRLALEIHLELALLAETPDDVLKNLWSLTRWLELLGAADIVQWLRRLIRTEAPGTWYVDKHNREQYIRRVQLSPHMNGCLSVFRRQVEAHVTAKLQQVIQSAHTLESVELLVGSD